MFGLKNRKIDSPKFFYEVEDYLTEDKNRLEKYEFWDSRIIKLNEPSYFFKSVQKLEKVFEEKSEQKNYRVFSNFFSKQKKLIIEEENCLFYPDLFAVDVEKSGCYKGFDNIFINPLIIVEISEGYSNSTNKVGDGSFLRDRTTKFRKYQKISSLNEYILIADYGGQTVVETYNRLDEETWKYQSYFKGHNNLVKFESIGITLPITEFHL